VDLNINDYLHIKDGKWEVHGPCFDKDPIYDTDDDDINRTLVFPHNLGDVVVSHVDPSLNPSYTINNNSEPFPPSEGGHEEECIRRITSSHHNEHTVIVAFQYDLYMKQPSCSSHTSLFSPHHC